MGRSAQVDLMLLGGDQVTEFKRTIPVRGALSPCRDAAHPALRVDGAGVQGAGTCQVELGSSHRRWAAMGQAIKKRLIQQQFRLWAAVRDRRRCQQSSPNRQVRTHA